MTESLLLQRVVSELRAEMGRQGWKQRHLAAVLDLSEAQISDRMRCRVAFNVPELEAIANALGVPVAQFLGAPERVS